MSETMTRQAAIATLRSRIIDEISKSPSRTFRLHFLMWADADSCFPGGPPWDGADFRLNLRTMKLHAKVSIFPSGSHCCESQYALTAAEFHTIALKYNMNPVLQCFETDEDWAALFDDRLQAAVDEARAILDKQDQERRDEERRKCAVVIPNAYKNRAPKMNIAELELRLFTPIGSTRMILTQKDGYYKLDGVRLTNAQAAWVEDEVDQTINNPYTATGLFLHDGNRMTVTIRKKDGADVQMERETPLQKYMDLQHKLLLLSLYGSRFKEEKPAEDEQKPAEDAENRERERSRNQRNLWSVMLQAWGKLRRGGNRK